MQCNLQFAARPDLLLDVRQLLLQLLNVPQGSVSTPVVQHQGSLAGSGLLVGGQITPVQIITNGFEMDLNFVRKEVFNRPGVAGAVL